MVPKAQFLEPIVVDGCDVIVRGRRHDKRHFSDGKPPFFHHTAYTPRLHRDIYEVMVICACNEDRALRLFVVETGCALLATGSL